jgi:hypothetical protein
MNGLRESACIVDLGGKVTFFQAERRNVEASFSEPGHFLKPGKITLPARFTHYFSSYTT